MYFPLAIVHALVLIVCAILSLRNVVAGRDHKLLAGFLLSWFNLVLTGLSLSLFSKLNNVSLYFATSCLIAVATTLLFNSIHSKSPVPSQSLPYHDDLPLSLTPLTSFAIAVLAIAAAGSALIAISYYPNNPDSIAYRFARVFLYLGRGNLMHPAFHDERISFYPFDGALAYLYFAIYRLDGRWFNFLSYAAWVISSLGVYTLSRDIGASRNGSFLAATIYALSPIVFVLATSTNDEVIAAAPVLIGLIFFHRWWHTGRFSDVVFGGIGFGLGAGTKLHIAFFWPVLSAAVLWIVMALYREGNLGTFLRQRWVHMAVAGTLIIILVAPFITINLIESKNPILSPDYSRQLLNKPFSPKVALINISLFSAQLFLSPLPALIISPDNNLKSGVYDCFNDFFNKNLFYWIDKNDHYNSCDYFFRGVAAPFGWWSTEETEWLGFAPFLMLFGIFWLWRRREEQGAAFALWLLSGFFVWHIYKSLISKYIEAASTYYSYPLAICAAGLAILWDQRASTKKYLSAALKYLFVFVIITHSLFALNILVFNVRRNLTSLVLSRFSHETIKSLPISSAAVGTLLRAQQHVNTQLPMPATALESLRAANKIHLVYTRWEFPFFTFMSRNPAARFTSSEEMVSDEKVLNILLYPARSEFAHIPLRIIGGQEKDRLTAIGSIYLEYGTEYIYGKGNEVHTVYPASSGFIVLHPTLTYDNNGATVIGVTFSADVMGADENDHFEYRLSQILADGKEYPAASWFPQNELDLPRKLPVPSDGGYLKVQVRSADERENIFESALPLKKGEDIKLPIISQAGTTPAKSTEGRTVVSHNPAVASPLIVNLIAEVSPSGVHIEGMREPEGPYAQWNLPRIRWASKPKVKIQFNNPAEKAITSALLAMEFRPHVRPTAGMTVTFNGKVMKSYKLRSADEWRGDALHLTPRIGRNIIEFSLGLPGGAKPPESLYMLFKTLSLKGEEIRLPIISQAGTTPAKSTEVRTVVSHNPAVASPLVVNLIAEASPAGVHIEGMKEPEGPYAQWKLPRVRWVSKPEVKIQFDNPAEKAITSALLAMEFRPHVRPSAGMTVKFNGKVMKSYNLRSADEWHGDVLHLTPKKGRNIIKFFLGSPGEPEPPDSLYMLFKTLSLKGN